MGRTRIPSTLYEEVVSKNAGVCCVCKTRGIGVNLHHIDHNATNNDENNLAVLCVKEHDAHHRPSHYTEFNHYDLAPSAIYNYKQEWERFVAEAQKPQPRIMAVINAYGSLEEIHAMRLIFQWAGGKVELERQYHQMDGPMEKWIDAATAEVAWLGPNISIVLVDAPLSVDYCPGCQTSLTNTVNEDVALQIVESRR